MTARLKVLCCVTSLALFTTAEERILENFNSPSFNYSLSTTDDSAERGKSTIQHTIVSEPSRHLAFTFSLDRGKSEWEPFTGVSMTFPRPLDASQFDGIQYRVRGAYHLCAIETKDVRDNCWHESSVDGSDGWKTVTITFKNDLEQPFWGNEIPFNPQSITGIMWKVEGSTGDTGTVEIDDVVLFKNPSDPVYSVR